MKKLFAIILMVVMVCTMSLSVAAAPGVFLQSPSFNKTPIVIEFECSDPNWKGDIYITSYGDRNILDVIDREKFEDAYESIRNSNGVSSLIPDIADISENLNISTDNLGISDLFHIGITDATDGNFKIKLDADTLNNFVGLVYFEDGKWYVVEDAVIEGEYLVFSTELPRAFAVVVDVDDSIIDVPGTGDVLPWVFAAVMVTSAAGIVLLIISYRKRTKA